MKSFGFSMLILAALAVSSSVASASQPHFGRMAFVHHHSPSTTMQPAISE